LSCVTRTTTRINSSQGESVGLLLLSAPTECAESWACANVIPLGLLLGWCDSF